MARVPMIQFRYGVRVLSTTAAPAVAEVIAAVLPPPPRIRRPISDEEIDVINLGGAKPYEAKKKR